MHTIEIMTPRGHLGSNARVLLSSGRLKLAEAEFASELKIWTSGSN